MANGVSTGRPDKSLYENWYQIWKDVNICYIRRLGYETVQETLMFSLKKSMTYYAIKKIIRCFGS